MKRLPNLSLILVALGAATWGTDTIFRSPLTNAFSPTLLVLGEHLLLALYAIPAVVLGWRQLRTLNAGQWTALLVIGWGGSAIATILFTVGIGDAFTLLFTPGHAAEGGNALNTVFLLQQVQPLLAVLTAFFVLRERLTIWYAPIFVAGAIGAYLVAFGQQGALLSPFSSLGHAQAHFALFALGAAALWGASTAMGRLLSDKLSFTTLTGARFLAALVLLLVLTPIVTHNLVGAFTTGLGQPNVARNLVLLAAFPGLIGLLFYYRGLRGTRASYATLAELAYPASGLILNRVVFGPSASISPLQVVGVVLVVGTIIAMNWLKAGVFVAPTRKAVPAPIMVS